MKRCETCGVELKEVDGKIICPNCGLVEEETNGEEGPRGYIR